MDKRGVLNVALRAVSLGSKFLLIFFLARFLPPTELGAYGLQAAAVGYGIYLVGLEFYTYASRELMAATPAQRGFIVKNQFGLYVLWYALAIPSMLLLAWCDQLPARYIAYTAGLLVSEHMAQELNRILIALGRQLYAGIVLFVRLGLWSLIVVGCLFLFEGAREVEFVLFGWLAGSIAAGLLALWNIRDMVRAGWKARFDPAWVRSGVRIALPLFLASVAVRGLATFDRFLVESWAGLEVLGAYVLYLGVGSAVISFLDAGIVDFALPKLVQTARARAVLPFRQAMARVRRLLLGVGAILVLSSAAVAWLFVDLLGPAVYRRELPVFYWVLFATAINIASIAPHLGLYALGRDRAIVHSQLAGLVVFVVVALACRPLGALAVVLGLSAAWSCILVWKARAFHQAFLEFNNYPEQL